MFRLVKEMFTGLFVCTIGRFGESLVFNSKDLWPISLNNRPCQTRPTLVVINSIETVFYWVTVIINKFSGSCITLLVIHMLNFAFQVKQKYEFQSI